MSTVRQTPNSKTGEYGFSTFSGTKRSLTPTRTGTPIVVVVNPLPSSPRGPSVPPGGGRSSGRLPKDTGVRLPSFVTACKFWFVSGGSGPGTRPGRELKIEDDKRNEVRPVSDC